MKTADIPKNRPNPNSQATFMANHTIPKYQLYGENRAWETPEPIHVETIQARSALHNWEIRPHAHDSLSQILYIADGGARAMLETQHLDLVPPCLIVVPPGQAHSFHFSQKVDGQIVSIPTSFQRELLNLSPELLANLAHAAYHRVSADTPCHARLAENFRQLAVEYHGRAPGRLSMLATLLTEVLVWIARKHPLDTPPAKRRHQQRIQDYRALIDEYFLDWKPVSYYAECLGISRVQLNTTCRRETGLSAKALIHERLMLEARRLLAFTDLDITTIALSLGFEDPAYFSRFFVRAEGIPPSMYRVRYGREKLQAPTKR